jgi:hypothetical protein
MFDLAAAGPWTIALTVGLMLAGVLWQAGNVARWANVLPGSAQRIVF